MTIKVNGEPLRLEHSVTVAELLVAQGVESPEMVAVQVNGELVDPAGHATRVLREHDEVEFLYFMGGGC